MLKRTVIQRRRRLILYVLQVLRVDDARSCIRAPYSLAISGVSGRRSNGDCRR